MDRKLAVILAADVAGYSRMVAVDEEGSLATLATYRTILDEFVVEHGGRIFGTAGTAWSPNSPAQSKPSAPPSPSNARCIAATPT